MAEGSVLPLFMGNDGSGPYAVSGQPGNGPLPVTFGAPPTGLDVNALNQFKGADGLTYDVKAATNGDGPLPVILANALGPLATDSLTQFKGTDNVTYNVKGAPGDGPLPVQLAAGGALQPVHIDPAQLPLPIHIDATSLPVPVRIDATSLPVPVHIDATSLPVPVTLPAVPATYQVAISGSMTVAGNLAYGSLSGSATKIIKVRRVDVTIFITAPEVSSITLARSATAAAGPIAATSVSMDTTNPAPSAVAAAYAGAAFPVDSQPFDLPIVLALSGSATPTAGTHYSWIAPPNGQPFTLHGAAQFLYVGFNNSATPVNGQFHISIQFTEE